MSIKVSASDAIWGLHAGTVRLTTHTETKCAGRACVIHNPSDHSMRSFPLHWRGDRGLMERTCPHGIGHPDPDDLAYKVSIGKLYEGVHGCDGCCRVAA